MAKVGEILGNRRLVAKAWNVNVWQHLTNTGIDGGPEFMVEIGHKKPYGFWIDSTGLVELISTLSSAARVAHFKATNLTEKGK